MNEQKQNPTTIEDYYNIVYPFDTGAKTRIGKGGYVLIHLPKHPMSFQGYYLLHRAVIEQNIGRFLYQCEQVHHLDRNRQNNDLSNLKLYATQRNHLLEEHSNSKINDEKLVALILEYADKRVKHDQLVGLDERFKDLMERYGHDQRARANMHKIGRQAEELERQLAELYKVDVNADFTYSWRLV